MITAEVSKSHLVESALSAFGTNLSEFSSFLLTQFFLLSIGAIDSLLRGSFPRLFARSVVSTREEEQPHVAEVVIDYA
jgi:hypothetical protein